METMPDFQSLKLALPIDLWNQLDLEARKTGLFNVYNMVRKILYEYLGQNAPKLTPEAPHFSGFTLQVLRWLKSNGNQPSTVAAMALGVSAHPSAMHYVVRGLLGRSLLKEMGSTAEQGAPRAGKPARLFQMTPLGAEQLAHFELAKDEVRREQLRTSENALQLEEFQRQKLEAKNEMDVLEAEELVNVKFKWHERRRDFVNRKRVEGALNLLACNGEEVYSKEQAKTIAMEWLKAADEEVKTGQTTYAQLFEALEKKIEAAGGVEQILMLLKSRGRPEPVYPEPVVL